MAGGGLAEGKRDVYIDRWMDGESEREVPMGLPDTDTRLRITTSAQIHYYKQRTGQQTICT